MSATMKTVLLVVLIALLGAGLAVFLDRVLSRPDRVDAVLRVDQMLSVRGQLLRYELEHGSLPRTLKELVPRYLRQEQIGTAASPVYRYDPTRRVLTQVEGSLIQGLIAIRRPPVEMTLPAASEAGTLGTPAVEIPDLLGAGVAVVPQAPELPEAPAGAFVFEAEHFTEMNYGWEVHPDTDASGGAVIHCWEGIANGPAQMSYDIFNFFDIRPPNELTNLRYHFVLPKAGRYHLYGRMWTTDAQCSNTLNVGLDDEGPVSGWMENDTPFRWVWTDAEGYGHYLRAGDHFLHVFIHEDGIRLDQFMLSPTRVRGGKAYRANLLPGSGTAWQKKPGPPVQVSFDLKTMVVSPLSPPDCRVVLRRLRPSEGQALLRVTLVGAALGGRDWRVARHTVDLSRLPEVCFVPLSFEGLDLAGLPRREYLLRAEVVLGEKVIATARVTLLRPFDWEVCGPFDFVRNGEAGPLDGDREPTRADGKVWVPLDESHMDHFGVLDFGLHTSGNSLHAPQRKTIYARTRVDVPPGGNWLFLLQSDDQMELWIDGKLACEFDEDSFRPVTRSARRVKIPMLAGEHRLRMRVNQTEGRWQAALRIRTKDDDVSNVVGLPRPAGVARK